MLSILSVHNKMTLVQNITLAHLNKRQKMYRYIFTFSNFSDAFIQSDLQLGNT